MAASFEILKTIYQNTLLYLRSGKTRKIVVKVNFIGKTKLERNLFGLNVLCIPNDAYKAFFY